MSENQPTLGIEIELPWSVMLNQVHQNTPAKILRESDGFYSLPEDKKAIVQRGFDIVDEQYLPKVAQANELGIPSAGNDGFTEFALHPRHDPREVVRDVDALYDLGLLSEKSRYPLHVTIGNIGATASAAYLLCSMEIVGDIRPDRVLQKNTWNTKGRGGVKTRMARELSLGINKGVELRTLELHNRTQLSDLLTTAHVGAQAIINKDPLWRSWQHHLKRLLEDEGLPVQSFWERSDDTTWKKYSELLGDPNWRNEAKRMIGRHAALLSCLNNDRSAKDESTGIA